MIALHKVGGLSPQMRRELIALHTEAFGDERAWIRDFLTAARGERYLAFTEGGTLCGGMFLLSAALCGAGERLCGDYIFALAVRREFRGRGIATSLLAHAKENAKDFLLLVPANAGLIPFYTARGFTAPLPGCTSADGGGIALDLSSCPVGGDYAAVEAAVRERGGLLLAAPLFAFALRERGLALRQRGKDFYAARGNEVFAAFGVSPDGVKESKALAYVKDGEPPRVLCDLLFEE